MLMLLKLAHRFAAQVYVVPKCVFPLFVASTLDDDIVRTFLGLEKILDLFMTNNALRKDYVPLDMRFCR